MYMSFFNKIEQANTTDQTSHQVGSLHDGSTDTSNGLGEPTGYPCLGGLKGKPRGNPPPRGGSPRKGKPTLIELDLFAFLT